MLTIKKDGVRIVNPDLTTSQTEDFNRDSIFKILVVECGFQATDRKNVWTHTKDHKFSVQFKSENNTLYFEYKYKSDKCDCSNQNTNIDFIEKFLDETRKFFKDMKRLRQG